MSKKFVFILGLFFCDAANAHILHVGEKTFQLDVVKRTSPALGVGIDGGTFYGALYSGDAPEETMHVRRDTSIYWLGQNCVEGKYSETGVSECTDCTIGHYCPGGAFHTACTYGAMSCKTKNNTTDQAMPAGAPINKFMTLDEVNEFMPVTDFSEWRQISCCSTGLSAVYNMPETINNASNACATGTIGPGTYLFTARYNWDRTETDCINGQSNQLSNAFIAVFDHPVAYASIHGGKIFQHFVDTEHQQYESYTTSTARLANWQQNVNATNITNLTDLPNVLNLCVYELQ